MSRQITDDEITSFQSKYGYPPLQLRVALDALSVYVNPDNPIAKRGLTLAELDAIFSSTRKMGHSEDIDTWGKLGLTSKWADAPIRVFSRNTASGTYAFFKEHVLKNGDYKKTNHELVGSEAVVESVAADPFGIGFCGVGYKTDQVAVVPLAVAEGQTYVPPDPQYAYSGKYPLARYLYLTINHNPSEKLSPLQQEVLGFVYSRDGQQLVIDEGFFPLSEQIAAEEREKAGM